MNYSELGIDVEDLKKGFQDARKELEDVSEQTKPFVGSYVDEFLDFCRYQRSLSENTIRSYRWDLKQWTTWLRDRDLELTAIKIKDIDKFIISLRKEGKSVGTVNRKIYCLKMFYRYLQRIEIIEKNPLDFMKNIREPKRLPKYMTKEQQEALLKASSGGHHPSKWGHWLRDRDRLMILLLLDTGVRISELCSIKKTDIDLEEGSIRIFVKGAKERFVILSRRCIAAIRECLKDENGSDEILFFNQQRRRLNTRHAFRLVQEIGERAGIKGLYPHLLRHTYATNFLRKGGDLLIIKEALGHSSVSTTEMYAHLGEEEYKEKLRSLIN